jgi:hypothetical protein
MRIKVRVTIATLCLYFKRGMIDKGCLRAGDIRRNINVLFFPLPANFSAYEVQAVWKEQGQMVALAQYPDRLDDHVMSSVLTFTESIILASSKYNQPALGLVIEKSMLSL